MCIGGVCMEGIKDTMHAHSTVQVPGLVGVCVDVSEVEVVAKEVERLKPIHLLVNNAAVGHLKKFLEVTTEEYDRS